MVVHSILSLCATDGFCRKHRVVHSAIHRALPWWIHFYPTSNFCQNVQYICEQAPCCCVQQYRSICLISCPAKWPAQRGKSPTSIHSTSFASPSMRERLMLTMLTGIRCSSLNATAMAVHGWRKGDSMQASASIRASRGQPCSLSNGWTVGSSCTHIRTTHVLQSTFFKVKLKREWVMLTMLAGIRCNSLNGTAVAMHGWRKGDSMQASACIKAWRGHPCSLQKGWTKGSSCTHVRTMLNVLQRESRKWNWNYGPSIKEVCLEQGRGCPKSRHTRAQLGCVKLHRSGEGQEVQKILDVLYAWPFIVHLVSRSWCC